GTPPPGTMTAMPNVIDGISTANGNRILLKNQTNAASNGIWSVLAAGTGANGSWERPPDFGGGVISGVAPPPVSAGAYVCVEEGNTQADTAWVLTNNNPIQVDGPTGDLLVWAQFAAAGSQIAGAGMTKTGNTFDVVAGDTTLTVNPDSVVVNTAVIATVASLAAYAPLASPTFT